MWTFKVPDERALAELLSKLRDLDMVFRDSERDWDVPAVTFNELRKRGLVRGPYRAGVTSARVVSED